MFFFLLRIPFLASIGLVPFACTKLVLVPSWLKVKPLRGFVKNLHLSPFVLVAFAFRFFLVRLYFFQKPCSLSVTPPFGCLRKGRGAPLRVYRRAVFNQILFYMSEEAKSTKRSLTVSEQFQNRSYGHLVVVPRIMLSGKWLAQSGFKAGSSVSVQVSKNQLIITKDEK